MVRAFYQPTCLGQGLGLYAGNLGLMGLVGPSLEAVCWQPTGLMGLVSLGLYVGNLQVLWGLLDPA